MYAKIFRQMYEGSLVAAGWQAMIVFQQLLILADVDGVVDMTAEAIHRTTGIPLEIIKAGIEILEQPDPESRTPAEDGRRIIRLSPTRSWGWRIVNYQVYRTLRSGDDRREYHRQYWREVRSPKLKTQPDSTLTQQDSSISTDAVSIGRRRCRGKSNKNLKTPASRVAPSSRGLNGDGKSITEIYDDDLPIPRAR